MTKKLRRNLDKLVALSQEPNIIIMWDDEIYDFLEWTEDDCLQVRIIDQTGVGTCVVICTIIDCDEDARTPAKEIAARIQERLKLLQNFVVKITY